MSRARVSALGAGVVVAVAAAGMLLTAAAGSSPGRPIKNNVLAHALGAPVGHSAADPKKAGAPLSGGVMTTLLEATTDVAAHGPTVQLNSTPTTEGCRNTYASSITPANVRVNQDCSFRRQAEEVVVANPTNPHNLIAGQNDSRIGFNHCGYDWSLNDGRSWGDQTPPFYGHIGLAGYTYDACSDPTVTFDRNGRAYAGGVLFQIFDCQSAVAVTASNFAGQFWHNPNGDPFTTNLGVVAEDYDCDIFHDKEFIVADASAASPKANNVYATWTRFDSATGNSPIYFSQSTNGGVTWSPGIEISGNNPAICTFGGAVPGACDQDQGSHPIVGPDGTIYVVFGNANTPLFGINQVAFVKCPANLNCALPASWSTPVKVGDLVGLHPIDFGPDGGVGCPTFRQCLPPNGYRVPEFTSMTASIDGSGRLYVSWADFRNGFVPPCDTLDMATAAPPCNNDVFYASSTDGGASWSSSRLVTPASNSQFGRTAQWQPWSDVTPGGKLIVGFYDRRFGNCEFTGCNDITVARVTNAASGSPSYSYQRITTSSMPNLIPANNPVQAGFLGDYMWVDVDNVNRAHIVWADTRGLNGTVEEDIYYATVTP